MPIPGTASRDANHLCPCIRKKYDALQDAALEAGILFRTVETRRDMERQQHYIAIGTSWTENSYHLPQPPFGLALAFDIVPNDYVVMKGWNPGGDQWEKLGKMGKALGLEWGGDWKAKDRPHFQQRKCVCSPEETVA